MEIKTIVLRRLTARDMRAVPEAVFSAESKNPVMFLPVIAVQTGIPEEDLENMDAADLLTAAETLSNFLVGSRQTGEK